jgi:UDP-N-acetylmuramyl-tripeptide synthetase
MKQALKKFLPPVVWDWYFSLWAFMSAVRYGFPSHRMTVIGVTGTNGKSTTVDLIHRILREAGHTVFSTSSLRFKTNDTEQVNNFKMTMPGRSFLQRSLKEAADNGVQYAVIEVTSEGIKQMRHKFIAFDIAVVTNVTPEHIESHGSFDQYVQAKTKLFAATAKNPFKKSIRKTSIININDDHYQQFVRVPTQQFYAYGIYEHTPRERFEEFFKTMKCAEDVEKIECFNLHNLVMARDVVVTADGSTFSVYNQDIALKLLSLFNVYNALAAMAVGKCLGVDLDTIERAIEKASHPPGRMDVVMAEPFPVFVDYAHTPDSLEKVYRFVHTQYKEAAMVCVLGSAGGGRDKWKRPQMGKLAGEFCQQIILTDEDPYDEDPSEIIHAVQSGIPAGVPVSVVVDRRAAIHQALAAARSNGSAAVVVTGKGAEPWMCVAGGKKIPWDDRQIVRDEWNILNTHAE